MAGFADAVVLRFAKSVLPYRILSVFEEPIPLQEHLQADYVPQTVPHGQPGPQTFKPASAHTATQRPFQHPADQVIPELSQTQARVDGPHTPELTQARVQENQVGMPKGDGGIALDIHELKEEIAVIRSQHAQHHAEKVQVDFMIDELRKSCEERDKAYQESRTLSSEVERLKGTIEEKEAEVSKLKSAKQERSEEGKLAETAPHHATAEDREREYSGPRAEWMDVKGHEEQPMQSTWVSSPALGAIPRQTEASCFGDNAGISTWDKDWKELCELAMKPEVTIKQGASNVGAEDTSWDEFPVPAEEPSNIQRKKVESKVAFGDSRAARSENFSQDQLSASTAPWKWDDDDRIGKQEENGISLMAKKPADILATAVKEKEKYVEYLKRSKRVGDELDHKLSACTGSLKTFPKRDEVEERFSGIPAYNVVVESKSIKKSYRHQEATYQGDPTVS